MFAVATSRATFARPGGRVGKLARTVRSVPRPLVMLLVLALAHGLAWAVVTAPFQGPDEDQHVAYAQYLAETGKGPNKDTGTGPKSTELGIASYELGLTPMLGHLEARPSWGRLSRVQSKLDQLPAAARKNGSGPNAAGSYPPLYYAYEAVAYRLSPSQSLLGRVFAMRLATIALFLVTVALCWLVACELFARPWARVLATGLVALNPKLGSLAATVNPDSMLVTITTAALLVAIKLVRKGPSAWSVLGIAALAAAGTFTHPRGLFLIPTAIVAVAVSFWVWRPVARRTLALGLAGLAVIALGLVAAVLWTRSHASGTAFGGDSPTGGGFDARQFVNYVWQFYLPKLSFMDLKPGPSYGYRQVFIESFYGGFASFEVNFSRGTYDILQVLSGLGLIALYTTVVLRARLLARNWAVVLVTVTFFVTLMGLLHLVSYANIRTGGDPVITGRYLLPAIALFALAVTWVASSMPRRFGPIVAALTLGGSALLALEGVFFSLQRFYG